MDHVQAVTSMATEKYLLGDLAAQAREEFEEHFFGCKECAEDVRSGATFLEHSKVLLSKPNAEHTAAPVPRPKPSRRFWSWAPAWGMVALLVVVGYQNLVTFPRLNHAQVVPWASINVGTWGSNGPVITASPGSGFLLFVRIPPDGIYNQYTADLYNPGGKLEWSLTIPAVSAQDQWPVEVPGANRQSGTYTLAVHGATAAGEIKEVGRSTFELQVR